MRTRAYAVLLITFPMLGFAQNRSGTEGPQPLYEVTIVSRTTKAINYGYRSTPTRIGFQGTPVAANATGSGVVEPKRGATLLNLRFDHLPPPSRFGTEYLTYVVWAISPEGRPQNLGELITDGSDGAKLRSSTPLQTFALIVTAEPYYSVSQPSNVVVLENVVTRDTIGSVQEVNATYELLPRKPYTHQMGTASSAPQREAVSQEQYESITALYQALNAIQIAHSQNADRYAPQQMARARALYDKARGFPAHLSKEIVSMAREAAQLAEDGRAIATKRAAAETEAELKASAPAASEQSMRQRSAESTQAAPPVTVDHSQFVQDSSRTSANRRRVLASLPRYYPVADAERGITISIPENDMSSDIVRPYFVAIASAVAPLERFRIHVEGHSNAADTTGATQKLADIVRRGLLSAGVPEQRVIAQGLGNTQPRSPGAGAGRNRWVEIVIAGDDIGTPSEQGATTSRR